MEIFEENYLETNYFDNNQNIDGNSLEDLCFQYNQSSQNDHKLQQEGDLNDQNEIKKNGYNFTNQDKLIQQKPLVLNQATQNDNTQKVLDTYENIQNSQVRDGTNQNITTTNTTIITTNNTIQSDIRKDNNIDIQQNKFKQANINIENVSEHKQKKSLEQLDNAQFEDGDVNNNNNSKNKNDIMLQSQNSKNNKSPILNNKKQLINSNSLYNNQDSWELQTQSTRDSQQSKTLNSSDLKTSQISFSDDKDPFKVFKKKSFNRKNRSSNSCIKFENYELLDYILSNNFCQSQKQSQKQKTEYNKNDYILLKLVSNVFLQLLLEAFLNQKNEDLVFQITGKDTDLYKDCLNFYENKLNGIIKEKELVMQQIQNSKQEIEEENQLENTSCNESQFSSNNNSSNYFQYQEELKNLNEIFFWNSETNSSLVKYFIAVFRIFSYYYFSQKPSIRIILNTIQQISPLKDQPQIVIDFKNKVLIPIFIQQQQLEECFGHDNNQQYFQMKKFQHFKPKNFRNLLEKLVL